MRHLIPVKLVHLLICTLLVGSVLACSGPEDRGTATDTAMRTPGSTGSVQPTANFGTAATATNSTSQATTSDSTVIPSTETTTSTDTATADVSTSTVAAVST